MMTLMPTLGRLAGSEHPWLRDLREECEGVFTCCPRAGFDPIARALSTVHGGQFWVGPNSLTWVCGRRRQWVLLPRQYRNVLEAREVLDLLDLEAGWTVGSIARALLKWAGIAQAPTRLSEQLIGETGWHYYLCRPGQYSTAVLSDMSGAYYHLLSRLPSPLVHIDRDGVFFETLDAEQAAKWQALIGLIGEFKLLRNCIVGVSAGSRCNRSFWTKGERKSISGSYGPLRTAALLCVRSCWELCQKAAEETQSVYANTDSVITTSPHSFEAWNKHGIPWRVQYTGSAEVMGLGSYKVGAYSTKFYDLGSRTYLPCEPPPTPHRWFYPSWL